MVMMCLFISIVEYQNFDEDEKEDSDGESSPEYPIFDRALLLEKYKVCKFRAYLIMSTFSWSTSLSIRVLLALLLVVYYQHYELKGSTLNKI